MAAPRAKSSTHPSSPAGEAEDGLDSMDLCGYGCHADGVPAGAVHVGCEHGTYAVTSQMAVKAAAPEQSEPNVHAQQLHHHTTQTQPADTSAIGPLLEQINALSERVTMLEGTVRQLVGIAQTGESATESEG